MKTGHLVVLATLAALAALFSLPAGPALGASYVVDTTDDDATVLKTACTGAANDCSLRGAITNANAASTPGDVITFDAAVFSPGTIAVASVLPALTGGSDTIDGTSATVIIDSTDEGRGFNCLRIGSAGNTVKRLQFTDCNAAVLMNTGASDNNTIGPDNTMFDNESGVGISVSTATGNTMIGNKIGTNAAGSAIPAEGGNGTGVLIVDGASNTVGGAIAADRNIISGNLEGIDILGTGATGNVVRGNFIGTDVTGTVDLGNGGNGVFVQSATSNTIGGALPGEGNLISGNSTNVQLSFDANNNTVQGNLLGPDISGGGALASSNGLILIGASGNTIGPGNVISDNSTGGVIISGGSGNLFKGNRIGTNPGGTGGLPNGGDGMHIQFSAGPNTIGGTNPGDGNVIAFNGGDGIEVNGASAPAATGNAIRGNSIHSNTGLEINNVSGGNLE
ncbi:MAG TPA: hypothetical protein VFT91_02835, partial [Dehalococcoidia bacterium]|nr:hypothetical protein [Dehalococcoidia bacterium]